MMLYRFMLSFLLLSSSLYAQTFDITAYGAKGDNSFDNTTAIQKAIDKAAVQGGTVVIPGGGVYLSGTIKLKTNVTLQVNKNATLKGIGKSEAYPGQPITHHLVSGSGQSGNTLIYAGDVQNVAITGEGTIDGNGGDTIFYYKEGMTTHVRRPYVILMVNCKNVNISDVTLLNSAVWMQRYIACDFLRIKGITVFNHVRPNNDGLDIDDCHEVVISDCIIDADDDAMCFKSESLRGVRNVVVTNCILSSHASAFKFGTGSIGGFQSVQFSNSVIRPSRATNLVHIFKQKGGLTGIDLASTDGGLVKDINITNVSIDSTENPIFIKLGNRMRSEVKDRTGKIEGLHFSQITIKNAGPIASAITGYPGNYVNDISFRDVFMEHNGKGTVSDTSLAVPENSSTYPGCRMFGKKLPASGFYVRHVKNIQFTNVQVKLMNAEVRPAIVCDDVQGAEITGLKFTAATGSTPEPIRQVNSNKIIIKP